MGSETSCVVTGGFCGVEAWKAEGGIAFVNVTCRQSPTFARNTIGRGRLPGRSCRLLPEPTVSLLRAKINAFGIVAPRRLSMITCGIATTSALTVRVPAGHGGGVGVACGAGAAFVVAASLLATVVATSTFVAGSDGFASVVTEVLLASTIGLPAATFGVCARTVVTANKLSPSIVNEVTTCKGDFKPSISTLLFDGPKWWT